MIHWESIVKCCRRSTSHILMVDITGVWIDQYWPSFMGSPPTDPPPPNTPFLIILL